MSRIEQLGGPQIAIVGGGGGASIMGAAFVNAMPEAETTIVVGEADSGSPTGRLGEQFGTMPMGDPRRVIAAVSATQEVGDFLNYRFGPDDTLETVAEVSAAMHSRLLQDVKGLDRSSADAARDMAMDIGRQVDGIKGHTLGNFLLTAYILDRGLVPATKEVSRIFGARARVLPVTDVPHNLKMQVGDKIIHGEAEIDEYYLENPGEENVWLEPSVPIHEEAAEAIANANLAVIAPGSRNTSIRAVMEADGIVSAVHRQREKGLLIAVTNLVNPEHDSRGICVGKYAKGIERYLGGRKLDAVIYNTATDSLPEDLEPVPYDHEFMQSTGIRSIGAPLLGRMVQANANDSIARSQVEHDGAAVVALVRSHILEPARYRELISA